MKYLVIYQQEGEGCGYMIGCGELVEEIEADDLVDDRLRRVAQWKATDADEERAQEEALRELVVKMLDKLTARGIISAEELIDWLDVPDAHDASVVPPSTDAIKELRSRTGAGILACNQALKQCDGDIDKATVMIVRQGWA